MSDVYALAREISQFGSGRLGRRYGKMAAKSFKKWYHRRPVGRLTYRQRFTRIRRSRMDFPSKELKFLDSDIPLGQVLTAGSLLDIKPLLIPQGITESTRIGRQIRVKAFQWRIHIFENALATPEHDVCRLIVGIDRQANGAQPAITDLLATASNVSSYYNLDNTGRFRILFDKSYAFSPRSGAGNGTTNLFGEDNLYIQGYHKLNLPVEYSAADGVIAEIRTNNLFMFVISAHGRTFIGDDSIVRVRFTG